MPVDLLDRKSLARKELARRELLRRQSASKTSTSDLGLKREALPFQPPTIEQMSPVPFTAQEQKLSLIPGLREARNIAQMVVGGVFPLQEREEAVATESARELAKSPSLQKRVIKSELMLPGSSLISAGEEILSKPRVKQAVQGERVSEAGDIFREAGLNETASATLGLLLAGALPSNVLAAQAIPSASKASVRKPGFGGRIGAQIAGVKQEALEDALQRPGGIRRVIQTRFLKEKVPNELIDVVRDDIQKFKLFAGDMQNVVRGQVGKMPFPYVKYRRKIVNLLTPTRKRTVGAINKEFNADLVNVLEDARIRNFGDALDFRRVLDDVIRKNKDKVDISFAKTMRNELNKILHQNQALEQSDAVWEVFANQMDEIGDSLEKAPTGRNLLRNFRNLDPKIQRQIVLFQQIIEGGGQGAKQRVIADIIDSSIAREFAFKPGRGGLSFANIRQLVVLPLLRFGLRTGALARTPIEAAKRAALIGGRGSMLPAMRQVQKRSQQ